jgi:Tfp pilus assembly protein PilX
MMTPYPQTYQAGRPLGNERGVAMLTILMLILILTVIGLASITSTSLDIKMAGGDRMRVSSINAAEACMSSAVQIIQQTLQGSAIPTALLAVGANPKLTQAPLESEILGQSDNNPDTADPSVAGAANAVLSIPNAASPVFTVYMDIDRLYSKAKAGGSLQFASGYEGSAAGAAGGGVEIFFRIDCYAKSVRGLTTKGRITGVYACVATGDTCQRKV